MLKTVEKAWESKKNFHRQRDSNPRPLERDTASTPNFSTNFWQKKYIYRNRKFRQIEILANSNFEGGPLEFELARFYCNWSTTDFKIVVGTNQCILILLHFAIFNKWEAAGDKHLRAGFTWFLAHTVPLQMQFSLISHSFSTSRLYRRCM